MQNPQFVSPAGRLELGNIGSNPTEKIWFANLTNGCVSRREEGQEACDWISYKREKLLNFESKSKKSRVRLASFHFRFEWDRRRDLCLSDSFHSLIRNSGCVRFFGWRLSKVRFWRARGKNHHIAFLEAAIYDYVRNQMLCDSFSIRLEGEKSKHETNTIPPPVLLILHQIGKVGTFQFSKEGGFFWVKCPLGGRISNTS